MTLDAPPFHLPLFASPLALPPVPTPCLRPLSNRRPSPAVARSQSPPSNPAPRPQPAISRRNFLVSLPAAASLALSSPFPASANLDPDPRDLRDPTLRKTPPPTPSPSSTDPDKPDTILGHRTGTGVVYVEFDTGSGATPQWGDFVNIDFVLYTVSPTTTDLVQHLDSNQLDRNGYLFHHGNGELILGLEEMVHTMSPGARRRCVFPRELGYTQSGLGPIPAWYGQRKKFLKAVNNGDVVVFDLTLNWFVKDPDDRGYFTDLNPTDEELLEIFKKARTDDPLPPNVKVIPL